MPLNFDYLNQFQRPAPAVDPSEIYRKAKEQDLARRANEEDYKYKRALLQDQEAKTRLEVDNAKAAQAMAAQDAEDQQHLSGIYQQIYSTPDPTPDQIDTAVLNAAAAKLRPRNFLKLQTHLATVAKDRAAIDKDQFGVVQYRNARMANLADQAAGLDDQSLVAAWPEITKQAKDIDPNVQIPAQPPDRNQLKLWGAHFATQAQWAKAQQDKADLEKKQADAKLAGVNADVADALRESTISKGQSEAAIKANEAATSTPDPKTGLTKEQQAKLNADMLTGDYKNYLLAVPEGQRVMKPFDAWLSEDANRKKANTNVNVGTFQLAEDGSGNPVLFNSKTGEIKPTELQKSGTKAKEDAKAEPLKDAVSYGQEYLDGKQYTGPGDEALLEKFFELAKPSTGFRMTQAQMDMLSHSRGLLGSAAANIHHAMYGTWFTDAQRAEIVKTMKDIAKAKGMGEASKKENMLPGDITIDEINAEIERRKKGK